jgi:hypothetical protein
MKSSIIIMITLALALTVSAQSQPSQIRVTLDNGYFSMTNAKTGQWLGGVSLEKWKRIASYTDNPARRAGRDGRSSRWRRQSRAHC